MCSLSDGFFKISAPSGGNIQMYNFSSETRLKVLLFYDHFKVLNHKSPQLVDATDVHEENILLINCLQIFPLQDVNTYTALNPI